MSPIVRVVLALVLFVLIVLVQPGNPAAWGFAFVFSFTVLVMSGPRTRRRR